MWLQTILIVTFSLSFEVLSDLISLGSTPSPPTGQDITNKVFNKEQNLNILPAAYGDFNGDKLTDIVTLDNNQTTVIIYLASKEAPYMRQGPSWNFAEHEDKEKFGKINSVTMGDFTGDGLIDLMITTNSLIHFHHNKLHLSCIYNKTNPQPVNATLNVTYTVLATKIIFCVGDGKSINCSHEKKDVPNGLVQEPMAVDLNRDMILDLVGEIWETHFENKTSNYTNGNGNCTCALTPTLTKVKAVWFSEEGRPAIRHVEIIFDGKNSTSLTNLPMAHPSSNAYVDVDGDMIPELVLITNNSTNNGSHVEFYRETYDVIYERGSSKLNLRNNSKKLIHNEAIEVLGQSLFMDLERNSNLVHIIPFCGNKKCATKWGLLIGDKNGEFHKIELGPFSMGGSEWKFVSPVQLPEPNITITNIIKNATDYDNNNNEFMQNMENTKYEDIDHLYSRSLVLQAGDYNLDGYPDLIAVLESHSGKQVIRKKAVIFENVPCAMNGFNLGCPFSRTFQPNFDFLKEYENVTSASFFDLKENGILDVLTVQEIDNLDEIGAREKGAPNYAIHAFETSPNVDSYFIKAMVLSGRPCSKCLETDVSYGNLISGAVVRYTMGDADGRTQTAISTQAYRSGYTTLDIPYTIFGIGHSPNFVDHLYFSVGYRFSSSTDQTFTQDSRQIIPNSQIIGIPSYPIQDATQSLSWRVKLFLTPGDAVLQTFGVLIGIIAVVGVLASGLEYKERRIDRKERMAEARRFLM